MMFQNPDDQIIFPTVAEELALGLQPQGLKKREALQQARSFLAERGLEGWADRAISTLSQGQRQHVCWLSLLLAVLNRHAGIQYHDQDVFLNAVGGVRITEPAADLAVVLAVLSSLKNRPLPPGLAVFGELGLAGEVRPSPRGQERLREALKLGFSRVICPKANAPRKPLAGLEVVAVERIGEALEQAWD